ncbi:hypothetical protein QZH41_001977 [Actinostola sp. cb2023]|nr:hypothetical protein QZH41_001977 [Actinostola sp. cb2023]
MVKRKGKEYKLVSKERGGRGEGERRERGARERGGRGREEGEERERRGRREGEERGGEGEERGGIDLLPNLRMEVVAEIEKTRRSSDTENGAPQSFTNPVASVSDQEEPSGTKSEVDRSSTASDKTPRRRFNLSADILQIMVPLLMQDGPFLILRLVLLIEFSVSSETHIYFTGKNILTVVLLLYRLYGLKLATEYPIPGGPRGSLSVALASDVSVPIDEITVQDDAVKHEVMVHQDIEVFELDETEESKDDSNQSGIQQSSALDPDHTTDLVL